ncbi:MerR family transcriptional regulator [Promicromonospora vindobonensis]|uniref:MerR family transcriptional regulator n=1 Tax=Promicromonospora vindobonensis TaxID=195748 RepID=A0ABW5VKU9_9MICO
MAWSTRQIAELAGTTVNTVRHYHETGLLDEPERRSNGYKEYGVPHLLRLLQIRRLRDLSVPLARIELMGRADEDPVEAFRALDAELASSIERLERARAELALVLRHSAPLDLPPGFSAGARTLSERDRSMIMIYSQIYDESALSDLRQILEETPRTDSDKEFDDLPPDADRATRLRLAQYFAPIIKELQAGYPWLTDPESRSSKSAATLETTMVASLRQLYNPAQRDVMYLADLIVRGKTDERLDGNDEGTEP